MNEYCICILLGVVQFREMFPVWTMEINIGYSLFMRVARRIPSVRATGLDCTAQQLIALFAILESAMNIVPKQLLKLSVLLRSY